MANKLGELERLILEGIEAERRAYKSFERILTMMPTATEAYEQYAKEFGRPPLTTDEKRKAYIKTVLEKKDD